MSRSALVRLRVLPGHVVTRREQDPRGLRFGWSKLKAGETFRATPDEAARLVELGAAAAVRWWLR